MRRRLVPLPQPPVATRHARRKPGTFDDPDAPTNRLGRSTDDRPQPELQRGVEQLQTQNQQQSLDQQRQQSEEQQRSASKSAAMSM